MKYLLLLAFLIFPTVVRADIPAPTTEYFAKYKCSSEVIICKANCESYLKDDQLVVVGGYSSRNSNSYVFCKKENVGKLIRDRKDSWNDPDPKELAVQDALDFVGESLPLIATAILVFGIGIGAFIFLRRRGHKKE